LAEADEIDDLASNDDHDECDEDPGKDSMCIVVVGLLRNRDIAERQEIELLVAGTTWIVINSRTSWGWPNDLPVALMGKRMGQVRIAPQKQIVNIILKRRKNR